MFASFFLEDIVYYYPPLPLMFYFVLCCLVHDFGTFTHYALRELYKNYCQLEDVKI